MKQPKDKQLKKVYQLREQLMYSDQPWFDKNLTKLQTMHANENKGYDKRFKQFEQECTDALARKNHRLKDYLHISFDEALPVCQQKKDIQEAIAKHQVVIVAGDTGSGKTTQLPKICLQLGLAVQGKIGCTQPRRLAARSMAERVAEECQFEHGREIGHQVRFTDQTGPETLVKFMTDGILLAETGKDPDLLQYSCLIIDEAHERSLNIDFLLGYLKNLLPKRPELKLIITSATIDVERFSRHFDHAPVISVSGRSWPVDIRYRPLDEKEKNRSRDLYQGIADACEELARDPGGGDMLVFLSAEREIHEAAEVLSKKHLRNTEILKLYARLPGKEQHRIFHPGQQRRIILSTNIAETSLTVPRIHFVVDSGQARISRYSHRSRVQRLPIEAISQAAARQRAGRCGRLAPGICIRLYSEEDYSLRPEFTEPEIQRTSLANVILAMLSLKLGEIDQFPFLDAPEPGLVNDAYQQLQETGALDDARQLTPLGRKMARLPMDVRLARVLLEPSQKNLQQALLVICSALSIQDPRERPADATQAADTAQQIFRHPESDFLSWLTLWNWLMEQRQGMSKNALRKRCEAHFINYRRVLEWQDMYRQFCQLLEAKPELKVITEPDYQALHMCLLQGFLGQIGQKHEKHEYTGARGRKFHLFPGSGLFGKPPAWILAAEWVETTRVYARQCARIEPLWLEEIGRAQCRFRYYDAHWSYSRQQVMAKMDISLFGLPLATGRRVHYGPVNPGESRQVFIREALARQALKKAPSFLKANISLTNELKNLEEKKRQRDILATEDELCALYEKHLPADVHNGKQLQQALNRNPELAEKLTFSRDALLSGSSDEITAQFYPEEITVEGINYSLSYAFQPGEESDGVTVHVPLARLNRLPEEPFSYLVPAYLREKTEALLRTLPKHMRRPLMPLSDFIREILDQLKAGKTSLTAQLADLLLSRKGIEASTTDFDEKQLARHLLFNFRVEDEDGRMLAQSRDLINLREQFLEQARAAFRESARPDFSRENITEWNIDKLPEEVHQSDGTPAWPALVDEGHSASLKLFETPEEAETQHQQGVFRLLRIQSGRELDYWLKKMPLNQQACMAYMPLASCDELKNDICESLLRHAVSSLKTLPRDASAFNDMLGNCSRELGQGITSYCDILNSSLELYREIRQSLDELADDYPDSTSDVWAQLDNLIYPGFLHDLGPETLQHYPRYLKGIRLRLQKLPENPARDLKQQREITPYWEAYLTHWETTGLYSPAFDELRWLLEEFRISLFAQELKTAGKVSAKRLQEAVSALGDDLLSA